MANDDIYSPYKHAGIEFIWSKAKAEKVYQERGIRFEEAVTVLNDPYMVPLQDRTHPSNGKALGFSNQARLLLVVESVIVEGKLCRIVTAWKATPQERKRYALERKENRSPIRRTRKLTGRRTFLGFLAAHGIPRRRRLGPPPPRVSRHPDTSLGKTQERMWAYARLERLRTTGERLRGFREFYGLTQSEVAERAGMDQPALSGLEHNRIALGVKRADALARVLGVPAAALLWQKLG